VKAVSSIVLRKGPLSVGIEPAAGGSLTRLDLALGSTRFDILRPAIRGPSPIAPSLNMSAFPLVPYAGRLRNGHFQFEGRSIEYPLNALPEQNSSHGDGFTREWQLTGLERDAAVLRIAPQSSAPIQYECVQTVTVRDDRVEIKLTARNLEARPIPFESGFHPYFAGRSHARVRANLPFRTRWDTQMMPACTGRNELRQEFARGIAAAELPVAAEFGGWNGQAVIEWPTAGVSVELQTRPALGHVVVWAPEREDFFCFEPLSHATDSFNRWRVDPTIRAPRKLMPEELCEQTCAFIVRICTPTARS
jgi:aldose 1-epimerase